MRRGTWRLPWFCSRRRRVLWCDFPGPLGRLGAAFLLPTLVPRLQAEETPRVVTSQNFIVTLVGSGAAVSWHGGQPWVRRAPQPPPPTPGRRAAPPPTGSELRPPLRPPCAPLPCGGPLTTPGAAHTLPLLTHQWPPSRLEASQGGGLCITSVWDHSWVRKCFSEKTSISVAACSLSAGLCYGT